MKIVRRSNTPANEIPVYDRSIALTSGNTIVGTAFTQPHETQNLPKGRQRETLVTTIISAIADDIADINRFPLRAKALGTGRDLEDDYLVRAFNTGPRTGMTSAELRRHIIWQLELTGECYLVDTSETITPLLAARVDILPAKPGQTHRDGSPALIAGYLIRNELGEELGRYDYNGTPLSGQAVGQLIRIHHPYPGDPLRCDAPVSRAKTSIDTLAYARQASQHALRNSGTPAGLIQIADPSISQESIDAFDRRLNSRLTDITQRGRVLAVGADVTYQELDTPDPSVGITTLADLATREILRVWSVPPSRLGDASERTYENQRVEMASYINNALAPRLGLVAAALTQVARQRGVELSFDLLAQELGEQDAEVAQRAVLLYQAGVVTQQEARDMVGFQEHINTDEQLVDEPNIASNDEPEDDLPDPKAQPGD